MSLFLMLLMGPSRHHLRERTGEADEKLQNLINFYADVHVFTIQSTL